jgi:hypothetical protein
MTAMKISYRLLLASLGSLVFAGQAFAVPIDVSGSNGEDSLQTVLDNHTVGGSSSIDLTTL